MHQTIFHGILVDAAFLDRHFVAMFPSFARKVAGEWGFHGIIVPRNELDATVSVIQANMRSDKPFYSHLYDDDTLVAIFKDRVFFATSHSSSWKEIQKYGLSLNIPNGQLDFWPNRFQDEIHYFSQEDFIST